MFLQREEPLIPLLYDQMVSFLTKLAGRFMPVSTIKEAVITQRTHSYTSTAYTTPYAEWPSPEEWE